MAPSHVIANARNACPLRTFFACDTWGKSSITRYIVWWSQLTPGCNRPSLVNCNAITPLSREIVRIAFAKKNARSLFSRDSSIEVSTVPGILEDDPAALLRHRILIRDVLTAMLHLMIINRGASRGTYYSRFANVRSVLLYFEVKRKWCLCDAFNSQRISIFLYIHPWNIIFFLF